MTTEGSSSNAARRTIPGGVIVVPFVLGLLLTLAIVAGLGIPITAGWVFAGALLGVMLSTMSLFYTYTKGQAGQAQANAGKAAALDHDDAHRATRVQNDPLAAIQAVESQGRRYLHTCVNCGGRVTVKADECPNCGQQQVFHCKGCNAHIRLTWDQCPECGRSLP